MPCHARPGQARQSMAINQWQSVAVNGNQSVRGQTRHEPLARHGTARPGQAKRLTWQSMAINAVAISGNHLISGAPLRWHRAHCPGACARAHVAAQHDVRAQGVAQVQLACMHERDPAEWQSAAISGNQ